jgi:hypothetical protein
MTEDWRWKYIDLDDVNVSFRGENVSGEFRRLVAAANEALTS